MPRSLRSILIGVIALLASAQLAMSADAPFLGKRAIFDEGLGWATREGADRTLDRIRKAGFNVYVPCVWHGRGTSWPSKLAPWDPFLKEQPKAGYDPLRYLIGKAHEMGIEVHPWFTVALRQSDLFPEFAAKGTPADAFDVHDKKFRDRIATLIAEVAKTYDVDGINLDYVRAVGICLSESCKREYQQTYARDLGFDSIPFRVAPGRFPSLIEFQESAVSEMVRTISQQVRSVKRNILLSVDAIPDVASADQGQNSIDWVNRGWVDVLFRMDYYRRIDGKLTDSIRSRLRNPDRLTLLISNVSNGEELAPGQNLFSRDGRWLADTVALIRGRWPRTGIGVYILTMLSDEQVGALRHASFSGPVVGLEGTRQP